MDYINMRTGITIQTTISDYTANDYSRGVGVVFYHSSDSVERFSNLEELKTLHFSGSNLYTIADISVSNANCPIVAVGVSQKTDEAYLEGIKTLLEYSEVFVVLTDYTSNAFNLEVADLIKSRYDVIFCSTIEQDTDPVQHSQSINQRNVTLTTPKITFPFRSFDGGSAIVAHNILSQLNNYGNMSTNNLYTGFLHDTLDEPTLNQYLYHGVTVLEPYNTQIRVVRFMSTNTLDSNSAYSTANRDLDSTVKLVDVYSQIKSTITDWLSSSQLTTTQSLNSIIITTLEELKSLGLLSDYSVPVVEIDPDDQAVCSLTLALTLARNVQQISMAIEFRI